MSRRGPVARGWGGSGGCGLAGPRARAHFVAAAAPPECLPLGLRGHLPAPALLLPARAGEAASPAAPYAPPPRHSSTLPLRGAASGNAARDRPADAAAAAAAAAAGAHPSRLAPAVPAQTRAARRLRVPPADIADGGGRRGRRGGRRRGGGGGGGGGQRQRHGRWARRCRSMARSHRQGKSFPIVSWSQVAVSIVFLP